MEICLLYLDISYGQQNKSYEKRLFWDPRDFVTLIFTWSDVNNLFKSFGIEFQKLNLGLSILASIRTQKSA